MEALRTRWIAIRESFWAVPTAVVVLLAILALALVRLDRRIAFDSDLDLLFGGDASAARGVLSTVAGSLVTVAGVTLSLTIVTFQLVAGQYSPRAVRNLVGDRMIQLTAGAFVGVVAYCLLVLRDVRAENGAAEFVPRSSVTVAIALALVSLALLIAFVHHVASTIRVENIAASVAHTTLGALDALYPERLGIAADEPNEPGDDTGLVVFPERAGFVQTVEVDEAAEHLPPGSRLELHVAAGDFVTARTPLATLRPAPPDGSSLEGELRGSIGVTSERTVAQDAAFGMRQLADIALRAISPSVNDPTTAVLCIGYLQACLERLATRELPARERRIHEATVVARRRTFAEHVEPLVELSRYARQDARVTVALLEALGGASGAAGEVGAQDRIATLREVAEAVAQPALAEAKTDHDRALLEHALSTVPRT